MCGCQFYNASSCAFLCRTRDLDIFLFVISGGRGNCPFKGTIPFRGISLERFLKEPTLQIQNSFCNKKNKTGGSVLTSY